MLIILILASKLPLFWKYAFFAATPSASNFERSITMVLTAPVLFNEGY